MKTHENYVNLKIAKLLQELGFDWECKAHYQGDTFHEYTIQKERMIIMNHLKTPSYMECVSCPTLFVTQKWLREMYHIEIQIKYLYKGNPSDGILEYRWNICFTHPIPYKEYEANLNDCYSTYEVALEVGIEKALNLLKEKLESINNV